MTEAPGALTLDLGYAERGQIAKGFTGAWKVKSLPSWLKAPQRSGAGGQPLTLAVQVDRNLTLTPAADEPLLQGEVAVQWQAPGSDTWQESSWHVQARRYTLSGQVLPPPVRGQDVGAPGAEAAPQSAEPLPSRIIVKYRSAAVAQVVGAERGTAAGAGVRAEQLQALSVGEREAAQETLQRWQGAGAEAAVTARLGAQTLLAETDAAGAQALLETLRRDPAVEYAVPSAALAAQEGQGAADLPAAPLSTVPPVVPTDQYAPLQWAFRALGYGAVWRDMEGGGYTRPVTVAVLDSGVRYDHPDLAGQLLTPAEGALDVLGFVPEGIPGQVPYNNGDGDGPDRDPTDAGGKERTGGSHGTHVSGIIAARWGELPVSTPGWSTSGVVGASYRAPVRVLPIRVIDAAGKTEVADVIAGLRYIAGQEVTLDGQSFRSPVQVQVANLSLGGPIGAEDARPLCDAVAEARAAGILVVAASGNYGHSSAAPVYPAACPGAVAVAATTLSGSSASQHPRYSSHYPQVLLSAPGGDSATTYSGGQLNGKPTPDQIFSTDWNYAKNEPQYSFKHGTSQAAPQVSALAALLLSKGVTAGPQDTLDRMVATATDLGAPERDELFGAGMINAAAALNAPAVSSALALSVQSEDGRSYQPPLDAQGRWTAYLGGGTYTARASRDLNGNALPDSAEGLAASEPAALSAAQPEVTLPPLTLPPLTLPSQP